MPRNSKTDTQAPDRYDVTIYLADGATDRYDGVTEARATQLEETFGASPAVMRIDVRQIRA